MIGNLGGDWLIWKHLEIMKFLSCQFETAYEPRGHLTTVLRIYKESYVLDHKARANYYFKLVLEFPDTVCLRKTLIIIKIFKELQELFSFCKFNFEIGNSGLECSSHMT